jgi:hypothetical protein
LFWFFFKSCLLVLLLLYSNRYWRVCWSTKVSLQRKVQEHAWKLHMQLSNGHARWW